MKKIYKFYFDCGRMGELDGLFISEEDRVKDAIGKEVYFGEVLGKHSEIYGELEEHEIEVITEDQDFIKKAEIIFGDIICGYNPLDYI